MSVTKLATIITLAWMTIMLGLLIAWYFYSSTLLLVLVIISFIPLIIAIPFFLLTAPTTGEEYERWKKDNKVN